MRRALVPGMEKEKKITGSTQLAWNLCNAECHDPVAVLMPWFESLSDFVTALSPRRQPQDQLSAAQRGPTTTPPPRTRRAQPSRSPFTLGFDDDTYPSEVTAGGDVPPSTHPEVRIYPSRRCLLLQQVSF